MRYLQRLLCFFLFDLVKANFEWILYNTLTDSECFLYEKHLFCHHNDTNEAKVCKNGIPWKYSSLKALNITTDVLLTWQIPFQHIEQYAKYLQSNSLDNSICNCTSSHIGWFCRYERPLGEWTIHQTVHDQLARHRNRKNTILVCLVDGIQCNSGSICLEWRQICDGIVQCADGSDE
ncbi:unnamed protein product, partial [Adineta ricciae]